MHTCRLIGEKMLKRIVNEEQVKKYNKSQHGDPLQLLKRQN
jgi:hypothetical protein